MIQQSRNETSPERIAFLGDFPPRLCGIATFTHDLCESVSEISPNADCYAGAVSDLIEGYDYSPRVRFEFREKELDSYRRAADWLNFNNADVLCLQHEFGIYGGIAGGHILALLKEVRMPVVTTLHTVLNKPDPSQRKVMDELAARSDRLVVMAEKGAEILRDTYGVSRSKVEIIPHGIADLKFAESKAFKAQFGVDGKQVLLTFGLIGPGKGIEYVIEALPAIVEEHPNVVYLILGATHPQLLASEGERYRLSLDRRARELGVKQHVIFHNHFVSPADLNEFIGATDIYVTPYLNEAQVTSGTLAYVFGAGRVVVSTPYWHAQELLADNRGVLVPFRDSGAIALAISGLLNDEARMKKMGSEAYAIGRGMIWSAVAKQYVDVFQQVCAERTANPRAAFGEQTLESRPHTLPPRRLDHLERMSDATGIFQHATFNVPNFHEGYCTDDNARAFILCNLLDELGDHPPSVSLNRLANSYLAFLAAAIECRTGRYRNFMSHGRQWLEAVGSEDSQGRAVWATGLGAGRCRDVGHQKLARQLFESGLPPIANFTSPRSWAFALIGINEYLRKLPLTQEIGKLRRALTEKLLHLWDEISSDDWPWFEASLTYENARLSQALIVTGLTEPSSRALDIGLESLRWLASIQTTQSGCFRPIGSDGFYERGGVRADFDQQPVEAQAMVSACHAAFHATGDPAWQEEAKRSFEWFLGRNDLNEPVYDFSSGGCCDGLHADRVNQNQGAESTLAFHIALAEMEAARQPIPVLLVMTPAEVAPSI
ncbi:MAG: glycosyltransferase involved in cell wall biosynthesis [Verrucomicrobiales bacterium]|jgi:glycosyltransferase involved in cell wall biosynthesis